MKYFVCLIATFAIVLLPRAAHAQSEQVVSLFERNGGAAESYRLDLTVPESPAFAILGLDSPEVVTPRDLPSFATELTSFFDNDGTLKPGGAITAQPWWFGNRDLTLDEYRNRWVHNRPTQIAGRPYRQVSDFERAWLARTSVSVALAPVEGQEDSARLGVGVTFRPLSASDPRLDETLGPEEEQAFRDRPNLGTVTDEDAASLPIDLCLQRAREFAQFYINARALREANARPELRRAGNETARDEFIDAREIELWALLRSGGLQSGAGDDETQFRRAVNAGQARALCVAQWRARQAERDNLMIAVGHTFLSETGQASDLDAESLTAWIGYSRSVPIGNVLRSLEGEQWSSRVNLYARYAESEQVVVAPDTTAEAEVSVAAISFNVIREQQWSLGVEAAYRTEEFSDATPDREFTQVALNGSYRVNDQMWLRASYGTRGDDEDEFVRVALVFAERARD